MNREFIICLLVFGLLGVYGEDDNIGSETQDSGNVIRFLDKNKRGAAKITNTDSPAFNHLTTSTASNSAGFKPSSSAQNPPAFKYLYNQQSPYVTYVPAPQAAQIAQQYTFQSSPVAHFLQTPTQLQYVAAPTIAQVPQIKYQTFSTATQNAPESASANSQYVAQSQQSVGSTQPKQVQLPVYSDYQTAQPVYYQHPLLAYYPQAQAANYIYQQPNANYLFKQQQIANIYGGNRFAFYTPTQNAQLAYLVPMIVSQPEQDTTTTTTSNLKTSDKSSAQQTTSTSSFSFGTKA